jgi:hypothetical protein
MAGGAFSAIPLKGDYSGTFLGIFGNVSEISCITLWYYITGAFGPMWLFPAFPFALPNHLVSSPITFEDDNQFHAHIETGRKVLLSLALEIGMGFREELFPDLDLSIFAAD